MTAIWNDSGTFPDVRTESRPPVPAFPAAPVQAFGQVKFSARAKLATMEGIAPVQDRLDAVFPYMTPQQIQQVSLLLGMVGAGAAAACSPAAQVWQFDDGAGWSLSRAMS